MRPLPAVFLLLATLLVACAPAPAAPSPTPSPIITPTPTPSLVEAQVARVIDGDTIEVLIDGTSYRVRYIGIDTPEMNDSRADVRALAEEATLANEMLVGRQVVLLEKDVSETDRYGRLLRYVYVDGVFVNAELVASGYAQVATYPPDVKYQGLFLELQRQAQEDGLGLWVTAPTPTPTPTPIPTPIPTPTPSPTPTATPTPTVTPTPSPTPTTTPAGTSNVQITFIFYDGLVPRVESDEYVEMTNLGQAPQDLADWVLVDISEGYPSFTFPSYVLAPDESIRVYTNEYHSEWGGFSFGYGKAIWNNTDPDIAALYNAQGQEVSRRSY